jgi:hypothetical protein
VAEFLVNIELEADDPELDHNLRRSHPEMQPSVIEPASKAAMREIGWSLALLVEADDEQAAWAEAEAAFRGTLADLGRPAPESVKGDIVRR